MPGIPKTQRCANCKRRRVKCDQNWPTCTPCQRIKATCSGPQSRHKFIVNGSHAPQVDDSVPTTPLATQAVDESASETQEPAPWYAIPSVRCQAPRGGATFGFFRVPSSPSASSSAYAYHSQPHPTQALSSPTDHVASLLISQLATQRFADSATGFGYMHHVPRRMGASQALQDCVSLFCESWANYWRGVPLGRIVDLRLQLRAVRSLRLELDGPRRLAPETVAAVTILQRLETLFDSQTERAHGVHSIGMLAMLAEKGPPDLEDELDVRMALDSQTMLIGLSVARDSMYNFNTEEWRQGLHAAARVDIRLDDDDLNLQLGSAYILESTYWHWPLLLNDIRAMYDGIRAGTGTSEAAPELLRRCETALGETTRVGDRMIAKARSLGFMEEVLDPESPVGKTYLFLNIRMCELFSGYSLCTLFLTRMLRDLCRLRGLETEAERHDEHHKELCRSFLTLCGYLTKRGPITCAQYSTSMMFVLEGLEPAHRAYVANFILDVTGFELPCQRGEEAADFLEHYINAVSGYIVPTSIFPLEGSLLPPVYIG